MDFFQFVVLQGSSKWLQVKNGLENKSSSSQCGSESFMLRDGVCDEATNIEECLFDGGDCCLAKRNEELCRNCTCKMTVDFFLLKSRFKEEYVQMFVDKGQFRQFIQKRAKIVTDVENIDTCSMLCLDDENLAAKINSWFFNFTSRACKCTWINTIIFLTHDIEPPVNDNKTHVSDSMAFIQMSKQFTTGIKLVVQSSSTEQSLYT